MLQIVTCSHMNPTPEFKIKDTFLERMLWWAINFQAGGMVSWAMLSACDDLQVWLESL